MQKSTNNCKIYCRPILKFVSRLSFNALIVQGRTDGQTGMVGLTAVRAFSGPVSVCGHPPFLLHPSHRAHSLQEEQRELASFTITKQQCWAGQYYWGCGVVWLADDGDSDFCLSLQIIIILYMEIVIRRRIPSWKCDEKCPPPTHDASSSFICTAFAVFVISNHTAAATVLV